MPNRGVVLLMLSCGLLLEDLRLLAGCWLAGVFYEPEADKLTDFDD